LRKLISKIFIANIEILKPNHFKKKDIFVETFLSEAISCFRFNLLQKNVFFLATARSRFLERDVGRCAVPRKKYIFLQKDFHYTQG
jgi:hypothetical protein